ncbi:bis(5'-nucleosyl)-tetraphosphatase (symmetrical) YqeK [Candidatus Margulisiibacteriota bacterium]
MPNRAEIIKGLKQALGPARFQHSLRVEKTALALAKRYRVSPDKVSLAALLHDYARKYARSELLKQARKFKLKLDPVSIFEPKLVHAELSALLARRDFGVTNKEVLGAISKHTIGAPGMTRLEKIIYLADHIEEGRDFAGVKKARRLADRDLDEAIVLSASSMLRYLLDKGLPVHPGTVQTRNYYLLRS